MKTEQQKEPNSGAQWRRWDPHIHTPGTILNDQYRGTDAWERYLTALEASTPQIQAIGVTDYYSIENYERLQEAKKKGRLPGCSLIFPNIELRLGVGTHRGAWINVHLLIDPQTENHVEETKRFLSRLKFDAFGDSFSCTHEDLIKLGENAGAQQGDKKAALTKGAEQFKVSFNQLCEEYQKSDWSKENILIAIASGKDDGTSGLREGADATIRQEEEKLAHIIFASSAAQRIFWLGQGVASIAELQRNYGGLKPCIHGSDAHTHGTVGAPDENRYTWIKGDAGFDALRQACIDPESRAYVGSTPPITGLPSQVISKVTINNAPWVVTPQIYLNSALVAIIGARGSGKTALADIIAVGCDATSEDHNKQSFLHRASPLLGKASVTIEWASGENVTRALDGSDQLGDDTYPRVRYLSQQFVEELCASDGMTDALVSEIERVIFEAHPLSERDGASNFQELLELRSDRYRQARAREEQALLALSDRIGAEGEKLILIATYKNQLEEKKRIIERQKKDMGTLVAKGSEVRVVRLEALTAAAEQVRRFVRYYNQQEQQILAMQDEVADVRENQAPDKLRSVQERYSNSGFKGEAWNDFLMDFKGPVDVKLVDQLKEAKRLAVLWKGTPQKIDDLQIALIADDAELEKQPLSLLEAEISRLQALINVDKDIAAKFTALSRRMAEENDALQRLQEKLTDAEGAKDRIAQLRAERDECYNRAFEAITSEQAVLAELYAPIRARLAAGSPTLAKMNFSIERIANIKAWAEEGEKLFDLRQGPFKGRGSLKDLADADLKDAWENGDAGTAAKAIGLFREKHLDDLLGRSLVPKGNTLEYRLWLRSFAKWLHSTRHIELRYSVQYDGVGITNLSPGTRGIVLLLLYLALDDADDRPLVIDQPEENLDPKSIYDELCGLFCTAKAKRQVIIVTHNANLVVNTDAEQLIVAEASPREPNDLPPIRYTSGGLDNSEMRKMACSILEGGEIAFRERARRLRVWLSR